MTVPGLDVVMRVTSGSRDSRHSRDPKISRRHCWREILVELGEVLEPFHPAVDSVGEAENARASPVNCYPFTTNSALLMPSREALLSPKAT